MGIYNFHIIIIQYIIHKLIFSHYSINIKFYIVYNILRYLIKRFPKKKFMDSNWIRNLKIHGVDSIRFERLAWPRFGFEIDSKVLDSRTSNNHVGDPGLII